MLASASCFGKFGLTAIADDMAAADQLFMRFLDRIKAYAAQAHGVDAKSALALSPTGNTCVALGVEPVSSDAAVHASKTDNRAGFCQTSRLHYALCARQ